MKGGSIMRKTISLILTALLLLSLAACGEETETKYLETSVTQEFVGTVTIRTEKEYDAAGQLVSTVSYQNDTETNRTNYSYTENSVIMDITQDGESGTVQYIYEKDAAGNAVRTEMYVDDELYLTIESTYDENGNALSHVQHTVANGITYTTSYVYDENGNPVRTVFDAGNGSCSVTETTYDENGKVLTSAVYDGDGNLTSREEHNWNEVGVELLSTYDTKGSLTGTACRTYDEAGNLLTSETFDKSGELILRVTYTYEKIEVPVK